MKVRPAAVAGAFYPGSAGQVEAGLEAAFADAVTAPSGHDPGTLRAIVVPHAGWVYSGAVAASAYRLLQDEAIDRVVLVGPSHFVAFRGLAVPEARAFATPVGTVAIEAGTVDALARIHEVVVSDVPHAREHSLEVQLPFLQRVIPSGFALIPIAVGSAEADEVAGVLEAAGAGTEGTLTVISTDLSHYLPYERAAERDRRTADAVEALDVGSIADEDACGARGLRGLLTVAKSRSWAARLLDLRNSGDTAGDRSRVVGYGAFSVA